MITKSILQINSRLEAKYNNSLNVHYLHMYDKFLWPTSKLINRELFMPDNFHPSPRGYMVMINTLKPYFQGVIAASGATTAHTSSQSLSSSGVILSNNTSQVILSVG